MPRSDWYRARCGAPEGKVIPRASSVSALRSLEVRRWPLGQNFSWKPASGWERVSRIGANGSAAVGLETAVAISAGAGVGVTHPPPPRQSLLASDTLLWLWKCSEMWCRSLTVCPQVKTVAIKTLRSGYEGTPISLLGVRLFKVVSVFLFRPGRIFLLPLERTLCVL